MGAGTPLTYAIGDIHGRLDLLTTVLAEIEQHRAGRDRTGRNPGGFYLVAKPVMLLRFQCEM